MKLLPEYGESWHFRVGPTKRVAGVLVYCAVAMAMGVAIVKATTLNISTYMLWLSPLLLGVTFAAFQVARARVVAVAALILAGVLNFASSLFRPLNLMDEGVWTKAFRDLPLALLILTAIAVMATSRKAAVRKDLGGFGSLFAVWSTFCIISGLASRHPFVSQLASLRYYFLYPLLILVVARLELRSHEVRNLLRGIIVLGVVEGLLAIANFAGVLGDTYYSNYVVLGGRLYPRAIGTLGNPNNFGLFMGLPLLLIFEDVGSRRYGLFSRRTSLVLALVILAGLTLSFSKTAILALGIASWLFIRNEAGKRKVVLTLTVTILLGGIVMVGRGVSTPTSERLLGSRTQGFPELMNEWSSSATKFWFGGGLGSLTKVEEDRGIEFRTTDSMPLQLGLELGAFGLLLFSMLVLLGIRLALRASREDGLSVRQSFNLAPFFMFFLLFSPVATNFRLFPVAMFFWLTIGLSLRSGPNFETKRRAPESIGDSSAGSRLAIGAST